MVMEDKNNHINFNQIMIMLEINHQKKNQTISIVARQNYFLA